MDSGSGLQVALGLWRVMGGPWGLWMVSGDLGGGQALDISGGPWFEPGGLGGGQALGGFQEPWAVLVGFGRWQVLVGLGQALSGLQGRWSVPKGLVGEPVLGSLGRPWAAPRGLGGTQALGGFVGPWASPGGLEGAQAQDIFEGPRAGGCGQGRPGAPLGFLQGYAGSLAVPWGGPRLGPLVVTRGGPGWACAGAVRQGGPGGIGAAQGCCQATDATRAAGVAPPQPPPPRPGSAPAPPPGVPPAPASFIGVSGILPASTPTDNHRTSTGTPGSHCLPERRCVSARTTGLRCPSSDHTRTATRAARRPALGAHPSRPVWPLGRQISRCRRPRHAPARTARHGAPLREHSMAARCARREVAPQTHTPDGIGSDRGRKRGAGPVLLEALPPCLSSAAARSPHRRSAE